MLTHLVRYGCVIAVVAFAGLTQSVRPAPAGEPVRATPADADLYLAPHTVEQGAELAVRQLSEIGISATVTKAERFVVVSDCDQQWTLGRIGLLERAVHQFGRFADKLGIDLDDDAPAGASRLLCVLVNDHDAYREFAQRNDGVEAGWIAGYYASLSNRIVFYNDATNPAAQEAGDKLEEFDRLAQQAREMASKARAEHRADVAATLDARATDLSARLKAERQRLQKSTRATGEAKAIHEAIHLLAFNRGLQTRDRQYPFWLTEGLACAFETDRPNQAFGPDHEFEPRRRDFEKLRDDGKLLALETLVQFTAVPDNDEATAEVMYAQSCALFKFLYRHERADLAEFFRDFQKRPPGRVAPKQLLEMFRARFGDVESLEKRFLRSR